MTNKFSGGPRGFSRWLLLSPGRTTRRRCAAAIAESGGLVILSGLPGTLRPMPGADTSPCSIWLCARGGCSASAAPTASRAGGTEPALLLVVVAVGDGQRAEAASRPPGECAERLLNVPADRPPSGVDVCAGLADTWLAPRLRGDCPGLADT